jgi:hypothetical protein
MAGRSLSLWQVRRNSKRGILQAKKYFSSRKGMWTFWYKELKPYFHQPTYSSMLPMDVVIPTAEKDIDVLPYAIDGVRRNIAHPISQIFVVSPLSERIKAVCVEKQCIFVDERSVVNIDPDSINLVAGGVDRSKWYYQQLLKWSGDRFVGEDRYLVVDSDTVFIRPQTFERSGRLIMNFSDEYHKPYFDLYNRILAESIRCPVSFTSHQMLFEKNKLQELRCRIESINECPWPEAILKNLDLNEISGASDYETYGQYVFLHYRKNYSLEYWFNLSLGRDKLQDIEPLGANYGDRYKSISFHSWKK